MTKTKPRRGRPRKTERHTLYVRISDAMFADMRALAAAQSSRLGLAVTVSDVARQAIAAGLEGRALS